MNAILGIIIIGVGTTIGVNLIPGLDTTAHIITRAAYGEAVSGLVAMAVGFFVILVLFYVLGGMKDAGG